MSHRRGGGLSKLDQHYADLGLLRLGEAARLLGVEPLVLRDYSRAGVISCEHVQWNGTHYLGWRPEVLVELRSRMGLGSGPH
jgi:hypothetical protein